MGLLADSEGFLDLEKFDRIQPTNNMRRCIPKYAKIQFMMQCKHALKISSFILSAA